MPPFETAALFEAISDAAPAGPNLEFDADFGALERAAQGKPEQQYGDTIIPAEEPDWKEVVQLAGGLLERTRDVRVLSHFAVGRLHTDGLTAFAEAMALTAGLLDSRWQEIHPQLDPDDDNDPMLRSNALLRLAHPALVLKFLRHVPLANSPRLGQYSWRDIGVAVGDVEAEPRAEKPSEALIRSAFSETAENVLTPLRAAATGVMASAKAIMATFDDKSGSGTGPNLDDLVELLAKALRYIDRFAGAAPSVAAAVQPDEGSGTETPGSAAARPQAGRGVAAASLSEVSTRADALRLLDLVCQYYRSYEPSSPLPLLIERARRLGDKNFLDILRDLAPDGLMQAQNIVGSRDE